LKTKQIGKSQLFFLVFWEKAALVYKGNKWSVKRTQHLTCFESVFVNKVCIIKCRRTYLFRINTSPGPGCGTVVSIILVTLEKVVPSCVTTIFRITDGSVEAILSVNKHNKIENTTKFYLCSIAMQIGSTYLKR
jgi:hypothetical protein